MATADLRLSFGAMFIGCVFSVSFSGMAALQAFLYFRRYGHKDSTRVRAMVAALCVLDLTHTIFVCHGVWHYLVINWGNLDELDHLTLTVAASIAVTGLMTVIVHLFFAHRVWLLSQRNKFLTFLIVFLAIVRLGSAFATTSQMLILKTFSEFITKFRWLFTFGLAMTSLIDIIITGSLCLLLRSNRTGCSRADDLIQRIIVYTINNGLITTVASISAMICAAAMPNNFIFLSLHFVIAKCYMNSLLATLNTRDALREREPKSLSIPALTTFGETHPTQPHFQRQGSTFGLNTRDIRSGAITDSFNSVKVHIDVEQTVTVHREEVDPDAYEIEKEKDVASMAWPGTGYVGRGRRR